MATKKSDLPHIQLTGPYDSMRDYVEALEATGRLLRINEMDQDRYEATGFAYRLVDKYGFNGAPAFLVEKMKIDGEWMNGPVLANIFGPWDTEAMGYGVENVTEDKREMYRAAVDKLISLADDHGNWNGIKPVMFDGFEAPCKEIRITGQDIDVLKYPWEKCNPADGGRFINSGCVVMEDAELGRNVGTYRCQVKSATRIGMNPEVGQHGWIFLMAAKERGERSVKAAVVLGADPITWAMSCSKVSHIGEDEYDMAGAFMGKPLELVKCETSDVLVPANAEMVIEGEIPLDKTEEEGPHAEMYGYLGQKRDANFYMDVQAITHRRDPWFVNNHTGVLRGFHTAAMDAWAYLAYKRSIRNLVAIHGLGEAPGITVASIKKQFAGDGLATGQQISATNIMAKVIIVVDHDVDVLNTQQVLHAVGSRWQPDPATLIIPHARGTFLEPSATSPRVISKVIIDATKQLPSEGGPKSWPAVSRELLEEACPEVFELVDKKWPEYWKSFEDR
jgi:4-hydroxy-3-polyprenylbenzoate decarboxylase